MSIEEQKIIETEGTGKSERIPENTDGSGRISEVKHPVLGVTYEFFENGEKWVSQSVAEHRLGVRVKQFDRYCKMIEPPVIKVRRQTERYAYNFIKEIDIERMAVHYQKVLRVPLEDIAYTDRNKKTLSVTDAEALALEKAQGIFKDLNTRINTLETKNDNLSAEINRLAAEKSEIIENKAKEINKLIIEKSEVIESKSKEISQIIEIKTKEISDLEKAKNEAIESKKREAELLAKEKLDAINKKSFYEKLTIGLICLFIIGGGVGAVYIYNTYQDNDRLYDVSNSKTNIILSKEEEIHGLKERILNEENQYLKSQMPVVQNAVN